MCDQIKKLIKVHVIPRKFFEGIRGTEDYSVMIDSSKSVKEGCYVLPSGDLAMSIPTAGRFLESPLSKTRWMIMGSRHMPTGFSMIRASFGIFYYRCFGEHRVSRLQLELYEPKIKDMLLNRPRLMLDQFLITAMRA